MTTAVYILSSTDKVDSFALRARELEYDARKVFVESTDGDVRAVVFLDGSPAELKNAIVGGKDAKRFLNTLKSRVESMLKAIRVGQDDLRLFVHFGGQGENEVRKFNVVLGNEFLELDSFKCYAISFGNKIPEELFPNGIFAPPHGEMFKKMCSGLQRAETDCFDHLRSLRVLLSCVMPNKDGFHSIREIEDILLASHSYETIDEMLSESERQYVVQNKRLGKLCRMDTLDDCFFLPSFIDETEYETLMTELLLKGEQK